MTGSPQALTALSTLIMLGSLMLLTGALWFLVETFSQSFLWGVGCLLFWPAVAVFGILHWDRAWRPLLLVLAGAGLVALGTPPSHPSQPTPGRHR